ncbi:MAG TPA: hypothetical protein PLU72_12010 [Candidatus Ozemobacteraceae bacterium]|nr:hypothetical protein [Candidatus Ozemobacteraceae bacterium]HQG27261.1 hypothetical protein [Candidatus Ozemobacteraceae bacterium]
MNTTVGRVTALVVTVLLLGFSPSWAEESPDWAALLASIEDPQLRQTLQKSISAGLIGDSREFGIALSRARSQRGGNQDGSGLSAAISKACTGLAKLDRDAVSGITFDGKKHLFMTFAGEFPRSYQAAVKLAARFDPKVGTPELKKNSKEINEYLSLIENDPIIQHALKVTKTTMEDLKENWFGAGAGFEHVICGEMKSTSVSGYHWWYKFYDDDLAGRAKIQGSIDHANDTGIYTGRFTWDPDGSGPLPVLKKSKGGFTIGNSAQALLALGHIAIETSRRNGGNAPSAIQFDANINGHAYTWQLYTFGNTIRSLYPICGSGDTASDNEGFNAEYFDLEEDCLRGLYGEGSLSVH